MIILTAPFEPIVILQFDTVHVLSGFILAPESQCFKVKLQPPTLIVHIKK